MRAQDPGMLEKIVEAQKAKKKDIVLPKDMKIGDIKDWAARIVTRAKQNRIERIDGRTHKEQWSIPPDNYAAVAQQSAETYFPLAKRICEVIANFGRLTIDELPQEFGALERELVVVTVNKMRVDGYLKDYVETSREEKGLKTLELVEQKKRKLDTATELGMVDKTETKKRQRKSKTD